MCGIAGIYAFSDEGKMKVSKIELATNSLRHRGPDGFGIYQKEKVALGQTRLAIIDLSSTADQPIEDATGRYVIIANGEIHNYKALRDDLQKKGAVFQTETDSEVILHLYIHEGADCLQKLNGFFSFAIYDSREERLFIARDRYGIKPLLVYRDRHALLFASEMKALMALGIPREIDRTSLNQYFQLNYIPPPYTIFENVQKLAPGHCMHVEGNQVRIEKYYKVQYHNEHLLPTDYSSAKEKLRALLSQSVKLRLEADVPVGAFLSGGIDSSIIVAEASRYRENLETFSIGFSDDPYFDETEYAEQVAKKCNSSHHTFRLTNDDFCQNLHGMLEAIDEPFADSSALPMYILCRKVRNHVTVALAGDGADELFGGYHKHRAHYRMIHGGLLSRLVALGLPVWDVLPKSRHSRTTNSFRQLHRYAENCKLPPRERYWKLASVFEEKQVRDLLRNQDPTNRARERKESILKNIGHPETLNDILYTDMQLVLAGDMLHKVDAMSMANGLEVRTPYLDYNLVNFAFRLEESYKVTGKIGKRVLRDAYREMLPPSVYRRGKKGFEVPLLQWFRTELRSKIETLYLHPDIIEQQQIFNLEKVNQLKARLFSSNPGDVQAQIWAIIVFQHWWKKYME